MHVASPCRIVGNRTSQVISYASVRTSQQKVLRRSGIGAQRPQRLIDVCGPVERENRAQCRSRVGIRGPTYEQRTLRGFGNEFEITQRAAISPDDGRCEANVKRLESAVLCMRGGMK